jgi:hypothetical protein
MVTVPPVLSESIVRVAVRVTCPRRGRGLSESVVRIAGCRSPSVTRRCYLIRRSRPGNAPNRCGGSPGVFSLPHGPTGGLAGAAPDPVASGPRHPSHGVVCVAGPRYPAGRRHDNPSSAPSPPARESCARAAAGTGVGGRGAAGAAGCAARPAAPCPSRLASGPAVGWAWNEEVWPA